MSINFVQTSSTAVLYRTLPESVTSSDLNVSLSGNTLKVTCQGKPVITGTLFGPAKTVRVGTQSVPGGSSIFWEGEKESQAVWDSPFSSTDMEIGETNTALYRMHATSEYTRDEDNELQFAVGDLVDVISEDDSGWYFGVSNGFYGMFPANFCARIKKELGKCKATADYTAMEDNELTFKTGNIITILSKDPSGWWEGECNGKTGWFPVNFVDINDGKESSAPEPAKSTTSSSTTSSSSSSSNATSRTPLSSSTRTNVKSGSMKTPLMPRSSPAAAPSSSSGSSSSSGLGSRPLTGAKKTKGPARRHAATRGKKLGEDLKTWTETEKAPSGQGGSQPSAAASAMKRALNPMAGMQDLNAQLKAKLNNRPTKPSGLPMGPPKQGGPAPARVPGPNPNPAPKMNQAPVKLPFGGKPAGPANPAPPRAAGGNIPQNSAQAKRSSFIAVGSGVGNISPGMKMIPPAAAAAGPSNPPPAAATTSVPVESRSVSNVNKDKFDEVVNTVKSIMGSNSSVDGSIALEYSNPAEQAYCILTADGQNFFENTYVKLTIGDLVTCPLLGYLLSINENDVHKYLPNQMIGSFEGLLILSALLVNFTKKKENSENPYVLVQPFINYISQRSKSPIGVNVKAYKLLKKSQTEIYAKAYTLTSKLPSAPLDVVLKCYFLLNSLTGNLRSIATMINETPAKLRSLLAPSGLSHADPFSCCSRSGISAVGLSDISIVVYDPHLAPISNPLNKGYNQSEIQYQKVPAIVNGVVDIINKCKSK